MGGCILYSFGGVWGDGGTPPNRGGFRHFSHFCTFLKKLKKPIFMKIKNNVKNNIKIRKKYIGHLTGKTAFLTILGDFRGFLTIVKT